MKSELENISLAIASLEYNPFQYLSENEPQIGEIVNTIILLLDHFDGNPNAREDVAHYF